MSDDADGLDPADVDSSSPLNEDVRQRRPAKAAQRKRQLDFLTDLLRSLDVAIFCHLSVLYYLE